VTTPLRLGALLLVLLGAAGIGQAAPQNARDLYATATAREQALRADKEAEHKEYRAVVAAYEAIVRKFPLSGYVDNALWQGAAVAAEAFERFKDDHDRQTARRLLEWLADQYPASPYASKVRESLKKLDLVGAPPAPPAAQAAAARPAPPRKTVTLKDIRRTTLPDRVRVTIELDGQTTYRSERIDSPARVLFDLADTRLGESVPEGSLSYDEEVIRRVRVGRHPNQVTRVVIDLDGIARYAVTTLEHPYRIQVDCERTATAPAVAVAPRPAPAVPAPVPPPLPVGPIFGAHAIGPSWTAGRWVGTAAVSASVRSLVEPAPAAEAKPLLPAPAPARATPAAPPPSLPQAPAPAAPLPRGAYSLSRQLGLGAAKIVIDPGHGGHDPGAPGPGVSEAEIVLDVSLRLEALLREAGLDVVLTRRGDEYVPLEERPAIAMHEQADLFLSIHANASRNRSARGIETYFLNFANDPDAEAVAARENAANGRTMNKLPEIVKAITLNNKLDESRSFAGLIQRTLAAQLSAPGSPVQDHGVKQAPFVVLIGASMPSVLVEISFITNTQEGRLLKTPAYRQKIAQALFDGVRGYQKSLKSAQAGSR
jgi:N-acetylmuramoyl-L-alanine amidase